MTLEARLFCNPSIGPLGSTTCSSPPPPPEVGAPELLPYEGQVLPLPPLSRRPPVSSSAGQARGEGGEFGGSTAFGGFPPTAVSNDLSCALSCCRFPPVPRFQKVDANCRHSWRFLDARLLILLPFFIPSQMTSGYRRCLIASAEARKTRPTARQLPHLLPLDFV